MFLQRTQESWKNSSVLGKDELRLILVLIRLGFSQLPFNQKAVKSFVGIFGLQLI